MICEQHSVTLAAEVVRIGTPREGRAPGLGLRFTGITPIDEASLRTLALHPDDPTGRDFML